MSAALCDDPFVASYCGPTVLSAVGFVSELPSERLALFERAARLRERASVGVNTVEFYRYAIAASVAVSAAISGHRSRASDCSSWRAMGQ